MVVLFHDVKQKEQPYKKQRKRKLRERGVTGGEEK